ncbi:hypothetical protein INS49_015299 [Diaporthe citri]|uniref:uncharacterized protein n=1 Tax=Diaporthe citri TaxID=83186 RepID=UPI001C7FF848|nr:uncharacterized protein INS49_015299 [Diaporthe citri]KAG6355915.1 hypothetical protein INS49_015299 [Diaporthe citri]
MPPKTPSSPPSAPLTTAFAPYYPKCEADALERPPLPERPLCILDEELCRKPLLVFDEQLHEANFNPRPDGSGSPTDQPDGFSDPYLMPSLARNERLRLTMFWYYTRGLYEDGEFLQLLQEKLDLVQTFMGWEFALLGLVSEDTFTRLAASGLPLAVLPRRESTCSHTINQEPNTVFMLPNMANDWRFRGSPPVAQGGLRSYAGVQLRCQTPTGEYVALGSLCVASNSEHAPLTPTQEGALIRFADMLVAEIVSHSRQERRRQRNILARRLAECRLDDLEDAETHILDLIRQVYPSAFVEVYEASDDTIPLPNHHPINAGSVQDGLWEDTEYIDELIRTANFTKISTSRTVRAIIHPCQSHPHQKFLIVASSHVQTVFDNVDSWFVEKCATSLANIAQEGSLREATRAKDMFLRGITHQLRTPIHGVLASCELLTEELAARNSPAGGPDASATSPSSIIDTIRDSAKELMTTVNNILKLNRWEETVASRQQFGLQSLAHLEDDIMREMKQVVSQHDLSRIPILFENRLANDGYITIVDPSLLKECIQSLILNALSNDNDGAVIIVIAAPPDNSRLTFDILDAGCGIAPADQGRIFEAFEKINPHSPASMDGNVSLVASSQDPGNHGSHFRAEFYKPVFTHRSLNHSPLSASLHHIPREFYIAHAPGQRLELVSHFASFLEYQGFKRASAPNSSFVIIAYTPDTGEFQKLVDSLEPGQRSICLAPVGTRIMRLFGDKVDFFSGPFVSARLQDILTGTDRAYQRQNLKDSMVLPEARPGLEIDLRQIAELEIVTPPTPPPEADPIALLVDDNFVNLRILKMYCEKRNITYSTAINGQEAVERFEKSLEEGRPINLVLMDLQMPVCDGIEATRQIREVEGKNGPALPPSRILMITGQDSAQDKARSFAAGVDAFYVKPMGVKALDQGIGEHFPGFAIKIAPLKPDIGK